jgi:hypothetical protein
MLTDFFKRLEGDRSQIHTKLSYFVALHCISLHADKI